MLDAKCNTLTLKSWSIHKLIDLNQMLDICDIWRIRNPKKTHSLTKAFMENNSMTVFCLTSEEMISTKAKTMAYGRL